MSVPQRVTAQQITHPLPGAADVFGGAVLNVRGTMDVGEMVVAQAYAKGTEPAPGDDPPNTAVECFVHGTSFFRGAVPGAVAGADGAFILVAWSSPCFGTPNWTQFPQVECTPASVSQFDVQATSCLYFAWAPDPKINALLRGPIVSGRQLANDIEQGHGCRPLELHIPDDANQVSLVVNGGSWRHCTGASCASDAAGRAKVATTRSEYHRIDYRSSHTPLLNTNVNKLVGLWGPKNAPSSPIDPGWLLEIGTSNPTLNVPTSPRPGSLFLAMHDGFEWNNNSGNVTVQVSLS